MNILQSCSCNGDLEFKAKIGSRLDECVNLHGMAHKKGHLFSTSQDVGTTFNGVAACTWRQFDYTCRRWLKHGVHKRIREEDASQTKTCARLHTKDQCDRWLFGSPFKYSSW